MYPENQINPTPTDYLDQIAPNTPQHNGLFDKRPIIFAGIAAVVLLIIILLISTLSGGTKPTEQLAARLTITAETVDTATGNIKGSKLRALNSNLKIYLTNTIRDIEPILKKNDVNINKLDKKVLAKESNANMLSRLEDARLNAIYDRTYAREMSYQLDITLSLMRQIYNSTSSSSLKTFLDSAFTNLEPIQQQFSDYNQATS